MAPAAGDEAIAAAVHAAVMGRAGREERGEIRFQCPAHDDAHPSARWNPGKRVWHCPVCNGGGGFRDLANRLGVEVNVSKGRENGRRQIVATYQYDDEHGGLLFEVVRFKPKGFAQRRPDGAGGWLYNLTGTRRVLYRLPELLAADPAATVHVVEGEKDADRLRRLGLVATTCAQGAGKWRTEYADSLRGRAVVVLPDNDVPGRRHAEAVAASLAPVAASVKLLVLPNLAPKGDVSDWLAAGGTLEALTRLVAETPTWKPSETPAPGETFSTNGAGDTEHFTDLGNARRLVARHGAELRFCKKWGSWLVWDGRRWARDETGEVMRRAKATVGQLYRDALEVRDDDRRQKLIRHALHSESAAALASMVKVAESEVGIPVVPDQLDAEPWSLNVLNGTLDLRTGTLRRHERRDLITRLAPVEYDPTARLPLWETFLAESTGDDRELAAFLQRAVGYSLTGDVSEEVLFFIHGPQAAGKTTFVEAVKAPLGDYALTADFETFLSRKDVGAPRTDIARLAGGRFVASVEVDEGKRLAQGLVKQLTGGDTVTARFFYQGEFEFRPTFKLWLAANHAPKVSDQDPALWRRILRVPFERAVPKERRDPTLKARLTESTAARAAILAWAVQGCLAWQRERLGVPQSVVRATEAYRADMDVLREFFAECCVFTPDASTRSADLWAAYQAWAKENGERFPLSRPDFGQRLAGRGCADVRRKVQGRQYRFWLGIGLAGEGVTGDMWRHENPETSLRERDKGDFTESRVSVRHPSPVTEAASREPGEEG